MVIELPGGKRIVVNVPVKVTTTPTSNPTPSTPTTKVITHFVDENGKDISTPEEGVKEPKVLEGYEFIETITDANENKVHHYKKLETAPSEVENSRNQEQPSTPEKTTVPDKSSDETGQPTTTTVSKQELPNTGTSEIELFTPAVLAILSGLGLVIPTQKKKTDEE